MSNVKVVAVLGSGLMGCQVALNAAKHGFKTYIWDISEDALSKFDKWLSDYIAGRIKKGRITKEEGDEWVKRLSATLSLGEAVSDADLVIESVVENYEIKKGLIADCNKHIKPHCIIGTNSSAMPSSLFAEGMKDPSKLCNMHFFNPALVMELVEVVKGPHTSQETIDTVMQVSRDMGKDPICIMKEIDGFIVTKMVGVIQRAAYELVEGGYCTPREFDTAMEKGLNHPMGPFRLMDLTGIDLAAGGWYAKWQSSKDPADKPPQFLIDQYLSGNYGRKTGKGWYDYS